MDGGVVLVEIVFHRDDLALDARLVGTLGRHDVTFARVLLPGGQFGLFAAANGLERALDGHGVLARVQHAVDAANGVGMALADAAPPEGVVGAVGQKAVAQHTVE